MIAKLLQLVPDGLDNTFEILGDFMVGKTDCAYPFFDEKSTTARVMRLRLCGPMLMSVNFDREPDRCAEEFHDVRANWMLSSERKA